MRRYVRWLLVGGTVALLPFAAHALHRLHQGRELLAPLRVLVPSGSGQVVDPGRLRLAPFADAVYVGTLENRDLTEISGLVASRRRTGLLWGVNDSGSKPKLFAIGTRGRDLGEINVHGARNLDWEDISAFERDGRSYLVVADIGDNFAWRRRADLYVIEEPELGPEGAPLRAQVAWRIPFRYEDGPRDCEAFAVDPSGLALFVTKREVPPVLYGLEIGAVGDTSERVARRLGELAQLPQPTRRDRADDWLRGPTRSQVTAFSIAPDGTSAVLLTYRDAYQYVRGPDETWAAAFARAPLRISVPPMPQKEALAFSHDGSALFMTSEHWPSPLFRFDAIDPSIERPREKW